MRSAGLKNASTSSDWPLKPAIGPRSSHCWNKPKRCVMLWEIEILPLRHDPEAARVRQELALLNDAGPDGGAIDLAARGFLLEGIFPRGTAERLLNELLLDPLVETGRIG